MDIKKLQRVVVDALEDVKAQNIKVFNTIGLSDMFDRVVLASGTSNRQTRALAWRVAQQVKEAGGHVVSVEGAEAGEWVLVDLGDMVVHVMQPAIRDYYGLEEIWGGKPVRVKTTESAAKRIAAHGGDDEDVDDAVASVVATADLSPEPGEAHAVAEMTPAEEADVVATPPRPAARKTPGTRASTTAKAPAKTPATKTATKAPAGKVAKKAPAKKAVVTKAAPKKVSAKKAPVKDAAAKKSPAKAAAKKPTAKAPAAAKRAASTKRAVAPKPTAKKPAAKKTAARKKARA